MILRVVVALIALAGGATSLQAQHLLVPMDRSQVNHLKAYGLTYWTLEQGLASEWMLNYRGGSFLLPDLPMVRQQAALRGVTTEGMSAADVAQLRAVIDGSNMEAVVLEKAPKVAIYTPPNSTPWDDAVTMALEYAGIDYETIWDREVIEGDLRLRVDPPPPRGLHRSVLEVLHHVRRRRLAPGRGGRNREVAADLGFANVPELKKAVSRTIRDYVEGGGFLFAMCSATETLELALAAHATDIAAAYSDGTPPDSDASSLMDWSISMAFENAEVQVAPSVNAFSDIDGHQVNTPWRQELGVYTLFDFSAKFDPVPAMLTQNHESVIADFYGLTTSFRKDRLKAGAIVLAEEGEWAKYVHGNLGEGTWTFFGGHDPEDPEHQIGDPQTDLALHPNSPGYRLILNNVLFPAAKKKKLKT